mmetsp:Transcript_11345/g.41505  ORF Transcript_11345/g.41505 Transcript_11345/m.41505 type:complete len:290 (+) Transcript_11345:86-955(+)
MLIESPRTPTLGRPQAWLRWHLPVGAPNGCRKAKTVANKSQTSQPRVQRVDKLLSRLGYCTRKGARDWVKHKRVTVGPQQEPANRVDQKVVIDDVRVDGKELDQPYGLFVLLHKPKGCVCSHSEAEGFSVYNLLPEQWSLRNPRLSTVGRLDKDSTGLLLLTDIGQLQQHLTSPRHAVEKVYEVELESDAMGTLFRHAEVIEETFASGKLTLIGEKDPCAPAQFEVLDDFSARITITEGRYHQVKRMFASQGYRVTKLHRTRVGEYTLQRLAESEYRILPIPGGHGLEQ